jgi:hypothetical protein
MGHTEVLYVMEFIGIILIWMGYRWNIKTPKEALSEPLAATT